MSKDKKETFKKLANTRVNKALSILRLIGNLANRAHYDYTPDQAKQIISILEKEVKNIKEKFTSDKHRKNNQFEIK